MSNEPPLPQQDTIVKHTANSGKRVILASSFGNALEFFDFGIYNFFVIYFGQLFFPPSDDPHLGLLMALATLGVSFFMRPLGGILIGWYADRCGRKPAMVLTICLMTLGTLMIACAPTYATAGYYGTTTLVVARLLQGLATGGEVGAASSMLVESAPANRRGSYSSWFIATQGAATMFAGVTILVLTAVLPSLTGDEGALASWGWRIPFIIGVLLAPIGCWLRLSLENDPPPTLAPLSADQPKMESSFRLLMQHARVILIGILLTIGGTVATYISNYYYGTFSTYYLGIPQHYAHASMLMGGVITFIGSLYFGALSDRVGRKMLVTLSRIGVFVMAYPSFWLLVNYPHPAVLLSIVFVMVLLSTVGTAPSMVIISEMFPKRIRAIGFALVYSIGVAIFGGFAQFFSTEAIRLLDSLTAPAWYLAGATLLSSVALLMFKDRYQAQLDD